VFAVMRSLGIVALGILGYFIRIWWMLQIIWSVPILLLISYFWYVHCLIKLLFLAEGRMRAKVVELERKQKSHVFR
jgi:hypothetical protein